MTLREEIVQKVQTADEGILERIKHVFEDASVQTKYPPVLDERVIRIPEEVQAFTQALNDFVKIEPDEDVTQILEDMKRRPSTRKTEFDS